MDIRNGDKIKLIDPVFGCFHEGVWHDGKIVDGDDIINKPYSLTNEDYMELMKVAVDLNDSRWFEELKQRLNRKIENDNTKISLDGNKEE